MINNTSFLLFQSFHKKNNNNKSTSIETYNEVTKMMKYNILFYFLHDANHMLRNSCAFYILIQIRRHKWQ